MDRRRRAAIIIAAIGGGAPTIFQDSFTRADGAPGNGWYSPGGGTIAIASNALVVTPTEGETLIDTDDYSYEAGTGHWIPYATNAISSSTDIAYVGTHSLKVACDGSDARGCYLYLTDATILSEDMIVGRAYRVRFRAAVNAGSSVLARIITGPTSVTQTITVTSTTMVEVEITFIFQGGTPYIQILGMAAGEIIYVDALEVHKLSDLFALHPQAFPNAYAQVAVTRTAYTQAGVVHYADADNFVLGYIDNDKAKLVKRVGGTYTEVGSADITYGAGKVLKLGRSGTTYTVTYDDVDELELTISDDVFASAKTWGLFSTYDGNSFDDYEWGVN